mmetsp:Transcript_97415/g.252087  ORF Transcript_97415/g.252087 Transcript_97415/m.252087 type:complete len:213 (+) Transcript_97415:424-1062(+)
MRRPLASSDAKPCKAQPQPLATRATCCLYRSFADNLRFAPARACARVRPVVPAAPSLGAARTRPARARGTPPGSGPPTRPTRQCSSGPGWSASLRGRATRALATATGRGRTTWARGSARSAPRGRCPMWEMRPSGCLRGTWTTCRSLPSAGSARRAAPRSPWPRGPPPASRLPRRWLAACPRGFRRCAAGCSCGTPPSSQLGPQAPPPPWAP